MNRESAKSLSQGDVVSVYQARCARALLNIIALILAIMPITEHFWTFDRLGRGGQDFELGVLAFVSFLCLVLLLALHTKQVVSFAFFSERRRSFILKQTRFSLQILGNCGFVRSQHRADGSSSLDTLQLQLRI